MRLAELLAALPQSGVEPVLIGSAEQEVRGLAYHSADVRPGDLFAALRGFAHDGHRFVREAVARGAAALLVDHPVPDLPVPQVVVQDTRRALAEASCAFYGHPSRSLWVCGVTGTNGKTTTTFLVDAILRAAGRRSAILGTLGVRVDGKPVDFHASTPTTPEAPDLQRALRDLADRGVTHVSMEVTSHALALARVEGCVFRAAVFTNLTQDHLDLHGSLERYREAKSRLFAMVEPDGVSVINADDPSSEVMRARSRAPVWTYGIDAPATVRAEDVVLARRSSRFVAVWPGGRLPVALPLSGRFNVSNALAALAVALSQGVEPDLLRTVLETVPGVPGRFEPVDEGQDFTVIVDYAHTPDSLEKVLRLAADLASARRIVVFGCGGERDRTKRPVMGRIGTELADLAIFTSDNPRGEDPLAIIREIEQGALPGRYESIPDRRAAIERAIALAQSGDVVVIAGKGHETYQIVGDHVLEFDDREVAREVLRARLGTAAERTR